MRRAAARPAAASPRSARAPRGVCGRAIGLELQPRHRHRGRLGARVELDRDRAPTRRARRRRPPAPPSRAASSTSSISASTSRSSPAASSTREQLHRLDLVEVVAEAVEAVAERVPVGVLTQQRPLALARRAAGADSASAAPSTPQRARKCRRVSASSASDSITRSRQLGCTQSTLMRMHLQEVIGEPVDEIDGRLRQAARRVPAQRVARGRARRPARAASRASPAAARGARGRAPRSDAAIASVGSRQLGLDRRLDVVLGRAARDEAADPLGREVRVLDDRRAVVADQRRAARSGRSAARAWRNRIRVFSSGPERRRVDLHRRRARGKRSPPRSRCSRRSPARSGAGRDVHTSQWCSSVARRIRSRCVRPVLGGVRAVLGRAERVVGDEQLRAVARRSGPRPAPGGCTRAPPSPRPAAPARACARSPSCPSPAGR